MYNGYDPTLSLLKALVQSLVGELRFKKTHSKALPSIKGKKNKERKGHTGRKSKERNQDGKTTVTEMKTVFERLSSRKDTAKERISEFEEISKTKKQREKNNLK